MVEETSNEHTPNRRQRARGVWHRAKPWFVAGLLTFWTAMVLFEGWESGEYGEVLVLTLGGYFFIDLLGELLDSR